MKDSISRVVMYQLKVPQHVNATASKLMAAYSGPGIQPTIHLAGENMEKVKPAKASP